MNNIRDWCTSRQLWWGHRIPAWHCRNCKQITVARETPAVCSHCNSTEIEQETDVLDTWFSSGLWPFSTLGWPDETEDFKVFYPTSLLITGFDILFFWVARMIMLGLWCTGDVPFRQVHMHGLVRDAERQKMSKTKGNVVDPLELIDRFGTDACRIALLISAAPGADIALKEDRLVSARAFANKLWNASRLIFMNLEKSGIDKAELAAHFQAEPDFGEESPSEDIWIFTRLDECTDTVNRALDQHRYHEAAQRLWDFVWHDFCDWYLEVKKLRFQENSGLDKHWKATLTAYERMLRLLHPVMPFVTEELWQRLVHQAAAGTDHPVSISLARYPQVEPGGDYAAVKTFELMQGVITAARELRADHKLDPKREYAAHLELREFTLAPDDLAAIEKIARISIGNAASGQRMLTRSTAAFELRIYSEAEPAKGAGAAETRTRLEKENAELRKAIADKKRQLGNEEFVKKAPAKVVESLEVKLNEYEAQLRKNESILVSLREQAS
jgi:valyl-tRNA synthetase